MKTPEVIERVECYFSDFGKKDFTTHDLKHHDGFETDLSYSDNILEYNMTTGSETLTAAECINGRKLTDPVDFIVNTDDVSKANNRRGIRGRSWAERVYRALDREIYRQEPEKVVISSEDEQLLLEPDPLRGAVEIYNAVSSDLKPRESFSYGVFRNLEKKAENSHGSELDIEENLQMVVQ